MAGARLQDVAARVGVSLATASLALSGKGRISAEVREKIQAAADQLGYRVRGGPRMRSGRMLCPVGIIHLDDRSHEWNFIRPILLELERAMIGEGYAPVMVPVSSLASREHALAVVEVCGLGAVFSVQYGDEKLFEDLERRGALLVVVNNSNFQDRCYSVCVDDFQGAYEGALYLSSLGHRSIAFVEYERPDMPVLMADRFVGFRKALEEKQLPFSPDQRVTIPFMDDRRLVRRARRPFYQDRQADRDFRARRLPGAVRDQRPPRAGAAGSRRRVPSGPGRRPGLQPSRPAPDHDHAHQHVAPGRYRGEPHAGTVPPFS